MIIQWEYKIVSFIMNVPEMNKLGQEGWENYSNIPNERDHIERMYWKRPLK